MGGISLGIMAYKNSYGIDRNAIRISHVEADIGEVRESRWSASQQAEFSAQTSARIEAESAKLRQEILQTTHELSNVLRDLANNAKLSDQRQSALKSDIQEISAWVQEKKG